jgi:hypothetical protein
MNKPKVAIRVIKEILDAGLAESTWRDDHPKAYDDLVKYYRPDLEGSVEKVLNRAR